MENRVSSVLFSILFGLSSFAGYANTIDFVPSSCLICRHAKDDGTFVSCLFHCFDGGEGEIGFKPHDQSETILERWSLKKNPEAGSGQAVRTATLEAENDFKAFMERIRPKLVLTRERGGIERAFIDLEPGHLSSFSKPVMIRINDGEIFKLPTKTVWSNHAVLIDDPDFVEALYNARELTVWVETMGSGREAVHFDMRGIRRVIRWLNAR